MRGVENTGIMNNKNATESFPRDVGKNESGFSLIEVVIALVILLISVLGVFAAFSFATTYNGGNNRRSQALSLFQQEIELLRSAKFTSTIYNDPALTGGTKPSRTVTHQGYTYLVDVTVDNDPFTPLVQSAGDNTTTLKEITIAVTPQNVTGNWVTALQTKVVFRRVRAN